MARVQPLVELVDRLALAGAVDPGDHDDRREVPPLDQVELGVQQPLPELGLFGLVDLLVDDVGQRRGFEHRATYDELPGATGQLALKLRPSLSRTRTSSGPGRSGTKEKWIEGFSLRLMSASTESTGRPSKRASIVWT